MKIKINGSEHTFDADVNLKEVLTIQNFDTKPGIAIALNNSVVPKTNWNKTPIHENDQILIISATKGG